MLIVCMCILVCSKGHVYIHHRSQSPLTLHTWSSTWFVHVLIITSSPSYKSTTVVIVCSTRVFMRSSHHSLWPPRDHREHDYSRKECLLSVRVLVMCCGIVLHTLVLVHVGVEKGAWR